MWDMDNEMAEEQKELVEQGELIVLEYAKKVEDSIANYSAVNEYFGQHFESIVPALVVAWDTAPTKELQDSICKTEIVQKVSTPTTITIFYLLTFAKLRITVMKIFVRFKYDKGADGEVIDGKTGLMNDTFFIVGIEPFGVEPLTGEARKAFDVSDNSPLI